VAFSITAVTLAFGFDNWRSAKIVLGLFIVAYAVSPQRSIERVRIFARRA
jgi:hypothetical protein